MTRLLPFPSMYKTFIAVMMTLCAMTGCAFAQNLSRDDVVNSALADPQVRKALDFIDRQKSETAKRLVTIGRWSSPSTQKRKRAMEVARLMRLIGLRGVNVVDEGSSVMYVAGVIPGKDDSGNSLVFVSTLDDRSDTVDARKQLRNKMLVAKNGWVVGPGSDHASSIAAMLTAAQAYIYGGQKPMHKLVFAAVAQEESDLGGMKKLYADWQGRASAFVDILGAGHVIAYGAITIHQWTVVASGPDGHTLGGGLPNVNQGIARAVERIFQLPEARNPGSTNTVINIAQLGSGKKNDLQHPAFNHKPDTGWFTIDIRSMVPDTVTAIDGNIRSILKDVESIG